MSDDESSGQQDRNEDHSPLLFGEDDDSTTDSDIVYIGEHSSLSVHIPQQVVDDSSTDSFLSPVITTRTFDNDSSSMTDNPGSPLSSLLVVDETETISRNASVAPSGSDQPTPAFSAVNTETQESISLPAIAENQIVTRKRPGDDNEETSARKVSRVVADDQVPTSSRSCGGKTAGGAAFDIDSEEGEETINCSICMEPYTNSGPHRICCLKCGHVFGHSCIQRWLVGQKSCPLCNAKALMHDIRLLFTKNLIALDSAELQRTKNELEKVKISKEKLNLEFNRVKLMLDMREKELYAMKNRQSTADASNFNHVELEPEKEETFEGDYKMSTKFMANVAFEKDAGFRVGAYSEESGTLVVSQAISNPLYPSGAFGIRTIKMYDPKFSYSKSVLHQRQIRDLCFAKYAENTVLTCGIDRKAVLSNIEQNVIIHTFPVPEALWSCAWDSVNPSIFYVGSGNGRIMSYDVRSPNEILSLFDSPLDNSPVARMVFTDRDTNYTRTGIRHNGLLIQHLNSIWYGQIDNNACEEYEKIPLEGPFTNMDYDPKTQLILVTTRSSKSPKEIVNLQNVYQLNRRLVAGDDLVQLEPIRTAELPRKNQIFMTRSKIWSPFVDSTAPAAVATDWSEKEEGLWFPTSNNMSLYGKHSGDIVVDFVPASRGGKPYLISITTDRIRLVELNRTKRNR